MHKRSERKLEYNIDKVEKRRYNERGRERKTERRQRERETERRERESQGERETEREESILTD